MKLIKFILPALFVGVMLSSCLEYDLPDLPEFEDTEILSFQLVYRYIDTSINAMTIKRVGSAMIDSTARADATIEVIPSKSKNLLNAGMTMQNMVGYATISSGSTIKSIGSAPKLGYPGDFEQTDMQYEITAADGVTKRVWTLNVVSIN